MRLRSRHIHFPVRHHQKESTKCGKRKAFALMVGNKKRKGWIQQAESTST